MIIDPVLRGDKTKMSSLNNLKHCLSYHTNNNELIMVSVNTGEKLPSQTLNMKIFDSENNLLRMSSDIEEDVLLILKNLNDPLQPLSTRSNNIIDKLSHLGTSKNPSKLNELLNNDKGKNKIFVCFDNLYNDKSWSFKPVARDINLQVNLRDISSMRSSDYNLYSKYFNKFINEDHKARKISEEEFNQEIQVIQNELDNVIENLQNSELLLENALEQESILRDINEEIFTDYTMWAISVLVVILTFGLFRMGYMWYYLLKKIT